MKPFTLRPLTSNTEHRTPATHAELELEFEVGGQKLVEDANGGGVGGGKGKDRGVYKTRKSKDPTGPEANFLGEIKIHI